jgi:hypothetical protein
VTIFELNEKLKEDLVLNCGVWEAKSIIFKKGVIIIPEPFLETTIRWEKDTDAVLIAKGINKILKFKEEMDLRCFVTDIQYETVYGHPQALWGIFKENEEIFPN